MTGLRRNTNERYYQFVIWSELMCSFPWLAETERDLSDFVFYDEAHKPKAYAEIKGWWSTSGEDEIRGIRHDMDVKLGGRLDGGVMLILTSHARDNAKENFESLATTLNPPGNRFIVRSFETSPFKGQPQEFAVIGFLVHPKP